jgi:hypothetical protein
MEPGKVAFHVWQHCTSECLGMRAFSLRGKRLSRSVALRKTIVLH